MWLMNVFIPFSLINDFDFFLLPVGWPAPKHPPVPPPLLQGGGRHSTSLKGEGQGHGLHGALCGGWWAFQKNIKNVFLYLKNIFKKKM